jgi:hypothetical protein
MARAYLSPPPLRLVLRHGHQQALRLGAHRPGQRRASTNLGRDLWPAKRDADDAALQRP